MGASLLDKILITGARGFVGSSLCEKLSHDFDVIQYNRGDNIKKINNIKPNYLIHCAGEIYDKNLMFNSNVVLTHELLNIVKDLKNFKNFVYIGSSSEYGRKPNHIKESDSLEPDTIYEGTKACGSLLTRVFGKTYDFNTTIVRPFSLYGEKEQKHKFFSHLFDSFTKNNKVKLINGVHDWIHIDDFVNGVEIATLENKISGEVYHFGNGVQYTNFEVFDIFCKIFQKEIDFEIVKNHDGKSAGVESKSWVADINKVKKTLNWYPKYKLKEGILKLINFRRGDEQ